MFIFFIVFVHVNYNVIKLLKICQPFMMPYNNKKKQKKCTSERGLSIEISWIELILSSDGGAGGGGGGGLATMQKSELQS